MTNRFSGLVFVVLLLVGAALAMLIALASPVFAAAVAVIWFVCDVLVAMSIQLAAHWEQALVFRLGKFHRLRGPGLFLIIPVVDQVRLVDIRIRATDIIRAIDIPLQPAITKDNVPVTISGVLCFQFENPADTVIKVEDCRVAISQSAQTSLRDVVSQMTLDQLLIEREALGKAIEAHLHQDIKSWGLKVAGIWIQDISLPDDLKQTPSRRASAQRENCETISKANADFAASANRAAARTRAASPGATASNTVVLTIPIDVLPGFKASSRRLNGHPWMPFLDPSFHEPDAMGDIEPLHDSVAGGNRLARSQPKPN